MAKARGLKGGIMGRLLEVDLSSGTWTDRTIPDEDWLLLLGGKGLGAKLLLELLPAGVDPLSPDNLLVFTAGLLTGTGAPCSSRFNLSTKSPLTGGVSSSNCGGTFGMHLRRAGYDGLIVRGRAERPTHIEIRECGVRLRDARHLWGLDTVESVAQVPRGVGSLVIGPAGEHLVRYACIMSGHRTLGRTGTGAVMGAKNLKLVTAAGTQKVPVARPDAFRRSVASWTRMLQGHPITGAQLPRYGTAGLASTANATHTLPVRNFQSGHVRELGSATGEGLAETILVRNSQCRSCPIRCARVVELDGREVKGPEFETLGMMGPSQGIFDIEAITRLGIECDRLGMDTISCGSTLAFAMELKQRGMLTEGLDFGDAEGALKMLAPIAHREPGLPDQLAEGSMRLSQVYGGEDFAMHSKGLEFASYDPRGAVGLGLGYATAARGGCHLGAGYTVFLEALGPLQLDPLEWRGKASWAIFQQNLFDAVSSCGNCVFTTYAVIPGGVEKLMSLHGGAAAVASKVMLGLRFVLDRQCKVGAGMLPIHLPLVPQSAALSALVGQRISLGRFLAAGERANTLERVFNLREGLSRADDSLPRRLTHEPNRPKVPRSVVPLAEMLSRYYAVRDWDAEGVPTSRLLRRLHLEWLEPACERVRRGQAPDRRAALESDDAAARGHIETLRAQAEQLAKERDALAKTIHHMERSERALEVRGATFTVDLGRCKACGRCAERCPVDAIDWEPGRQARIDPERCIRCGRCEEACPERFDAIVRIPHPSESPPLPIHRVDAEACKKCGRCYKVCPVDAITWAKRTKAVIDEALCVRCGSCYAACPPKWAAILQLPVEEA